jgi:hypothetical protein
MASLLPEPLKKPIWSTLELRLQGALKLARRNRSQPINFLPQRLPWKHYGIDECYGL